MSVQISQAAPSLPLWQLLTLTAQVVQASLEGDSWAVSQSKLSAHEKPAVQALAFQTWRNWGRATALRQKLAPKRPPPAADALLCTALALIWDAAVAPYPAHTLVSQAVDAAKNHPSTERQSAFINAVLRRFLREQGHWVAQTNSDPVARHNHPNWWIKRTQTDHPQHWQAVMEANNRHPPLTLRFLERFSPLASDFKHFDATEIIANGSAWQQVGKAAFVLRPARVVTGIAGFEQGHFSVQDAAAQLAAPLLLTDFDPSQPLNILDACAAPGGKTAHLLSLAPQARVTALDVSEARLGRMHDNLRRLNPHDLNRVRVVAGDAVKPRSWWDGELFDAILLDAPCSASGIVRRQPDVRWIRRERDLQELAATQKGMLLALWPLLKRGGQLVFCTCSVFRSEGEDQTQAFQSRNADAMRLDAPGQLLPRHANLDEVFKDNSPCDHDGFFFARFRKA